MIMKLKEWNIKLLAIVVGLLIFHKAGAQDSTKHKLRPDYIKIQFAGGIGFFSVGAGWANKKQWLEGDIYYGYVPKSVGGINIHAFTGKLTVHPIPPVGKKQIQLRLLSAGVLLNYTLGKQYFGFTPSNYPYEYYGFPTSLHAAAFLGGGISRKLGKKATRKAGLYYEVITFDREFISYWDNRKALSISDIINVGIGLKLEL
jgi:hypothetical protein